MAIFMCNGPSLFHGESDSCYITLFVSIYFLISVPLFVPLFFIVIKITEASPDIAILDKNLLCDSFPWNSVVIRQPQAKPFKSTSYEKAPFCKYSRFSPFLASTLSDYCCILGKIHSHSCWPPRTIIKNIPTKEWSAQSIQRSATENTLSTWVQSPPRRQDRTQRTNSDNKRSLWPCFTKADHLPISCSFKAN